ncbi:hypothetical protein [Nocardioides pacificus]
MVELAILIGATVLALVVGTMRRDRVVALVLVLLVFVVVARPVATMTPLAAMIALTALAAMRRPEVLRARGLGRVYAPLTLLLVTLGYATWAHAPAKGWNFFALLAVSLLSSLLLMQAATDAERAVVSKWLVRLGVVVGLYAVLEVIGVAPAIWGAGTPSTNQIFTGLSRAQATMGHPLPLAFFLLVALLVAARDLDQRAGSRTLVLMALSAGLLATGSRSAVVLAMLFGVVVISRRVNFPLAAWIATLGLTLGIAFGIFRGDAAQRFLSSDSLSHRIGAFESVPRLLQWQDGREVWLGNGVFSAPSLFARGLLQRGEFYAVDNQFVSTLVEGGIVGLAALVWLLVAGVRTADTTGRLLILVSAAMFLSFDLLFYASATVMLGLALGRQSHPAPAPREAARSRRTAAATRR